MSYQVKGGTGAEYEENPELIPMEERAGVHHLVSGWVQQAQPEKVSMLNRMKKLAMTVKFQGLFLSSEFTKSGVGLTAIHGYYSATRLLAQRLSIMFEVLMPEQYEKYREAFDAGVWTQDDPGPWLGRVIVYKLQIKTHKDTEDGGPTASFPAGYFQGGEMLIPELNAKLA